MGRYYFIHFPPEWKLEQHPPFMTKAAALKDIWKYWAVSHEHGERPAPGEVLATLHLFIHSGLHDRDPSFRIVAGPRGGARLEAVEPW